MKHRYLTGMLPLMLLSAFYSQGQQWNGDNNTTSPIGRTGGVAIGVDALREPSRALDVNGTVVIAASTASDLSDIVNMASGIQHNADMLWLAMEQPQDNNPGLFTISSIYPSTIVKNYNTKFKVRYNGNVGIGTDEPAKTLDIQGIIQLYSGRNNDPTIQLKKNDGWCRLGAGNGLALWGNGNVENDDSPQMFVNTDGNVGIGTSSPTEKLSVNGNIRSKEVKVESTNWPDYVFQPQYRLPKLPEIEKYISENGHLPNMPSAVEVDKNGIALGEMNAKLLEKVEELTLLLIQQSKQLQAQQSEQEKLRGEVESLKKELLRP